MNMRVAGIMSGTSLDGIDVAVVDIGTGHSHSTVAFRTTPYPSRVRDALLRVSNAITHTSSISRLNFVLGELYADAVRRTCAAARVSLGSIKLIGCHGQTIYHEGEPTSYLGFRVANTLQIGESAVLAERTGIPVVSDFRVADIAAGGKGAPLVPYVDYLLYRDRRLARVALNIGGIANITAIPPGALPDDVIAFDTGPGNMVIDGLIAKFTHGRQRFDRGGRIASRGRVHRPLLDQVLADAYYHQPPPKTAGREQYGAEFVDRFKGLPIEDATATATALTAATIAEGIQRFVLRRMRVDELIVSGGGAHNPQIRAYLAAFLPGVRQSSSADFGIDVDAKEAIAFALLAHETWRRRPSNLPSATGARRPVVLGKISQLIV